MYNTYIYIYIYIFYIHTSSLSHVQLVFETSMFRSLKFSDSGGRRPVDLRCNLLVLALAAILHLHQGVLELVTSGTGT